MKIFHPGHLLSLILAIALSGCFSHKAEISISQNGVHEEEIAYFHYSRDAAWQPIQEQKDFGRYQVLKLTLPLSWKGGLKREVSELYYYRPNGDGPHPAIVVLPITQGDHYTEDFAIHLAMEGYAILRYESTKTFLDDPEQTLAGATQIIRHYIIDVRRGVDWLMAREEVDPNRLGILGISLGAITASVVMAADSRIKTGVLILGGGDLAGIIDRSKENSLMKFRQRVIAREAMDADQFRKAAAEVFRPIDPLTYANRLDPTRILMINGYFDRVIQRIFAKTFWEAAGRPKLIFLPTGHYSAAFLHTYLRSRTSLHFQKHLR